MSVRQSETPGQYRAGLRAAVKRAINAAAPLCDVTWRATTAIVLGVSRSRVDQVCALDEDVHLSVADACAYPEPVRHAIAQLVIGDGHAIVALPESTEAADDWRLVAAAQRESAGAIGAMLDAIADGRVTSSEGAKLEREVDEAIAALLGIRERARSAKRERVIGIRSAR